MLLGLGVESVATFLGVLGLRYSVDNRVRWKKTQDEIGSAIETVAAGVMSTNLDKEIAATLAAGVKANEQGNVPLTVMTS